MIEQSGWHWPDGRRECILCLRASIFYNFINVRCDCTQASNMINFAPIGNIVNEAGEYCIEDCFCSHPSKYEGIFLPVVIPSIDCFKVCWVQGIRHLEQLLRKPEHVAPSFFFLKSVHELETMARKQMHKKETQSKCKPRFDSVTQKHKKAAPGPNGFSYVKYMPLFEFQEQINQVVPKGLRQRQQFATKEALTKQMGLLENLYNRPNRAIMPNIRVTFGGLHIRNNGWGCLLQTAPKQALSCCPMQWDITLFPIAHRIVNLGYSCLSQGCVASHTPPTKATISTWCCTSWTGSAQTLPNPRAWTIHS